MLDSRVLFMRDAVAPMSEAEAQRLFVPYEHFALSCLFAAVIIDIVLCGAFAYLVIIYAQYQWHRDGALTRAVVTAASFMCFACSGFLVWFISYLFVDSFGQATQFFETDKISWFPVLDALTSGIIQSYFAYRAFLLNNRSWVLLGLCYSLIATSIGATIACRVIWADLASISQAQRVAVPVLVWLSSIMAADIIITLSILVGLLRIRTSWAHTDRLIRRLIRMTFESQLPPTILAVIYVVVFVTEPSSLLGVTLQGIQSKFYGIGLLYALNRRPHRVEHGVARAGVASVASPGHGKPRPATSFGRVGAPLIHVEVETETHVDRVSGPHLRAAMGVNRRPLDDVFDTAGGGLAGAKVQAGPDADWAAGADSSPARQRDLLPRVSKPGAFADSRL